MAASPVSTRRGLAVTLPCAGARLLGLAVDHAPDTRLLGCRTRKLRAHERLGRRVWRAAGGPRDPPPAISKCDSEAAEPIVLFKRGPIGLLAQKNSGHAGGEAT